MRRRGRLLGVLFGLSLVTWLTPHGMAQSSEGVLNKPTEAQEGDPSEISVPLDNVFISLEGTAAMGDEKAPLVIVEFGDYECPYSNLHANSTLPQIVAQYVKPAKVRYFYKDFPLEEIHPQAFKAAEAARCAGEQGKYWEMHDRFLRSGKALVISEPPANLALDLSKFQQCMDNGKYGPQIRKDIQEAKKLGVKGTPSFYVGTLDPHGSGMKAVRMLYGYLAFEVFRQTLDQILSSRDSEDRAADAPE
ncbi:MAG: DsbA family protein [Acidobacteria bacterium]|nr:DsbA family protein [Acidobacteriota bacterium]